MKEVFVRSPYNYDAELVSDETGLDCLDVSLTKQSFVEECDINTIVRRFGLTGELPDGVRAPTFGDFTEVVDFKTACDAVARRGRVSMLCLRRFALGFGMTLRSWWNLPQMRRIVPSWRCGGWLFPRRLGGL